jgi:ribonuclease HI
MQEKLEIYTDGSSLGNPGRGGWGVVITQNQKIIKELGGYEENTTNNKMEIKAVIESLKYLNKNKLNQEVSIFVDSNYVLLGITAWIYNWQKNGWRTANKKPVLNQDLWKELFLLKKKCPASLSWQKVKGHSGHIYNDRADEIASACAEIQKNHS